MTRSQPPRLALALLQRVVPDNEALIGDLIEEFEAGRSRAWFWRQTVVAIAHRQPGNGTRELHVVPSDHVPLTLPPAVDRSAGRLLTSVNMSGIPVSGVGGLGMIATVLLITIVLPAAWWLAMIGLVGGVALGFVRVAMARRHGLSGAGGGSSNTLLGGTEPLGHSTPAPTDSAPAHPTLTPLAAVRL
jgi:hypothetical protein